ncbi:MAG: winged helix-turn-helix domain-containing protein [DPANN group archaeon]|nr:winged helix-turn-helix domain-containing protein [DPANN group archaeon]
MIIENPRISRVQLSKEIGINQSAIQKHRTHLKDKQIIKRVGSDKGGHWEVVQ